MDFESLKKTFTSTPIVAHVDLTKPFIIEVDVSDIAFGNILSQQGDDVKLHPMVFHSASLTLQKSTMKFIINNN